jgi:hypothetical protein
VVPSKPRDVLYDDDPDPEEEPPEVVAELLEDLLLLLHAAPMTEMAKRPAARTFVEFLNFTSPSGSPLS